MFVDIAYALGGAPQNAESGQGGNFLISFMPLIFIFAIFYFLLIRPQSKKAKDHKLMLDGLKKGDKIITSGGIYGLIEGIEGNTLTIKIAENVRIKAGRNAVAGLRTGE